MRPLYFILILVWLFLSYYWCNKYYTCSPATASVSEAATGAIGAGVSNEECITDIEFEDSDLIVSSSENFRFTISEEAPIEPSDDFKGIISKVADYLSDNPDRFMRLTGYYIDGEENATDFEDLGMARARSVKEYLKENGFDGTQLNTNSEMLESSCVKDGVLLKGINVKFGEIPQ